MPSMLHKPHVSSGGALSALMLSLVSRNYEVIEYDTRSGVWPAPCARRSEDRAFYYCTPAEVCEDLGATACP